MVSSRDTAGTGGFLESGSRAFKAIDEVMTVGIEERVFPGAVLLVADKGGVLFHRAYGFSALHSRRTMTLDTVFDLASLTKPLATTLAVMVLMDRGSYDLDQPIDSVLDPFGKTAKGKITARHLLSHTSGLPDYRPYYRSLCGLAMKKRRAGLRSLLVEEPLINPIGKKTVYSDLGFMILAWVVETVSQKRLDRFITETIYRPLGIERLFFIDLALSPPPVRFAATERCAWRKALIEGKVHDENAYTVGGIEGHAGLFGTAADVYRLISFLLDAYFGRTGHAIFSPECVRAFFKRQSESGRALGFDMPSAGGSSSGRYFPSDSIGHLGFTGTSFWVDLVHEVTVVLLTNRVHPSRENKKIIDFRPWIHDTVMAHVLP